jgi:hypothetical protein
MDELPHRAVIDLQPTLGKFGDHAAQGEISLDPLQQPATAFAGNRLRPVTAYLAWPRCRSLAAVAPIKWPCYSNPEALGRLIAG